MDMDKESVIAYIRAEKEWHDANRGTSGKSQDFEDGFISALKHILFFVEGNYWLCENCKIYHWKDSNRCPYCKMLR